MKNERFFLVAGEKSGDHYGAQLVEAFRKLRPETAFFGFGGQEMKQAGVTLFRSLEQLEIIGFVEVLARWKTIRQNFRTAKKEIRALQPDALILIDYPGFNLRIARWAKQKGFKVFYYIAPQTWAWKKDRNRILRDYVDRLYVILPFEKDFFLQDGISAEYVGHPAWADIVRFHKDHPSGAESNSREPYLTIALLPGSRRKEIQRLGPVLMQLVREMPECRFLLAGISSIPKKYYKGFLESDQLTIVWDDSFTVLQQADLGLIKSGTSSLQAALFRLPHVVFYRLNPLSAWIIRKLIRISYVALPNLILDAPVVPELLQREFRAGLLINALRSLKEEHVSQEMKDSFNRLIQLLDTGQQPATQTATSILSLLEESKNQEIPNHPV